MVWKWFRIEGRDSVVTENLAYLSIKLFGLELELRLWDWRK